MRIEINEQAWNRGFWDGDSGKPSHVCPYAVDADERLSWVSGYIEGKAFRNGYIATQPRSRVPLRKNALASPGGGQNCAPIGGQFSAPIDSGKV
jgi:ribosome modulation factor